MKLNYTFKHLDHSDALVKHTEVKMEDIGKFLLKEGYGTCYYSKVKNEFCVEISVNTRERYFKATAFGMDVYATVDAVVDKLEKQFIKINKQFKDHKKFDLSKEGRLNQALRLRKAA